MQETWLGNDDTYLIPGFYPPVLKNRKKATGGVAIYIKEGLTFIDLQINDYTMEVVGIKIISTNKALKIINVYSTTRNKTGDYENITKDIEGDFILCGDFNSHHTIWGSAKNDYKGKQLAEFIIHRPI